MKRNQSGYAQLGLIIAIVGLIAFFIGSNALSTNSLFGNLKFSQAAGPTPAPTWQEHWFEHNQLVKLVYSNDDVAIYYDDDMDKVGTTWLNDFVTRVWQYSKDTYSIDSGTDSRLYANFHEGKYFGGHPSYYFDGSHDFRNVIDIGASGWSTTQSGWSMDATAHEIGHIVESANNGAQGSPTFSLWHDSKWMEIYQYDLYLALGLTADAQRWYDDKQNTTDDFPRSGTHWFRDWYFPVWRDYGQTQVLKNYFKLLSAYYPKNGARYSKDVNLGEYVHFMSVAAKADLKPLATSAFGWTPTTEAQYQQAKNEFPNMVLPKDYPAGNGLNGNYFNNKNLTGSPVIARTDPQISFNWAGGSPGQGIPNDAYSARWTGFIRTPFNLNGNLNFHTKSDDGVKVWINDQLVINRWVNQSASAEYSGSIALQPDTIYPIKVEYFDNYGSASVELRWSSGSLAKQLIPQSNLYTNSPSGSPTPVPSQTPTPNPESSSTPTPVPSPSPTVTPTPSPPSTPIGNITFSNVTSVNVTGTSATITWTTDPASSSKVIFGKSSSVLSSSTVENTSQVTTHTVTLTNLSRATNYYYRVQSRITGGNLETSPTILTFKTLNN